MNDVAPTMARCPMLAGFLLCLADSRPPAESTRLDEVTPQNYRSVTPTPSVLEYSVHNISHYFVLGGFFMKVYHLDRCQEL